MRSTTENFKKLIVSIIIILLSVGFIVIMINIWNMTYKKNAKMIDNSTTEILNTVNKELEENKDIYEDITKDIDSTILISAEKGLNKVKEDNSTDVDE